MRNVRKPVAGICTCSDPEGNIFTCGSTKPSSSMVYTIGMPPNKFAVKPPFPKAKTGKGCCTFGTQGAVPPSPNTHQLCWRCHLPAPPHGDWPMAVGAPLQVASRPQQVLAALCCASHAAITPLTGRWRCRSHGRWRRHDPQAPLLAVLAAQQASAGGVRTFFQSVPAVGSAVGVTVGRRIGHAARH